MDVLIMSVFTKLIMPLGRLVRYPANIGHDKNSTSDRRPSLETEIIVEEETKVQECRALVKSFRNTMVTMQAGVMRRRSSGPFHKWNSLVLGENFSDNDDTNDNNAVMAEVEYRIPRMSTKQVLMDMYQFEKLTREEQDALDALDQRRNDIQGEQDNDFVMVRMFFPRSFLPKLKRRRRLSEIGTENVQLDSISHLQLTPDVPVVLHFHGGGLTVGSAYDEMAEHIVRVSRNMDGDEVSSSKCRPFVFASVEYSLAPEHPFPTATVEALTVLSHFVDNLPKDSQLHLSGLSAGGNLAAVAAMEGHRRYPGRIESVLTGVPMLDPACHSVSYYSNSRTAYEMTVFLRWSWQAFLQLPPTKDTHEPRDGEPSDALIYQSNYTTWNECPWKGSSMERLINPTIDLPNFGPKDSGSESKPKFLITSNRGDPLCAEVVLFVEMLRDRAHANVIHLDHDGPHWLGTSLRSNNMEEFIETWRELLFA